MSKEISAQEAQESIDRFKEINDYDWPKMKSDIQILESFIAQQLRKDEPLTDEERKEIADAGFVCHTFNAQEDDNKSYDGLYICELDNYLSGGKYFRFLGIGHTQAEAERDAFEQAREKSCSK